MRPIIEKNHRRDRPEKEERRAMRRAKHFRRAVVEGQAGFYTT
jgi:hypothetical protein